MKNKTSHSTLRLLTAREVRAHGWPEPDLTDPQYPGLRLVANKDSTKSWIYGYRHPITQRLKQIKLGSYPDLSLSLAREMWRKKHGPRDSGINRSNFGERNQSSIIQTGSVNYASTTQVGNTKVSTVAQLGNGNSSVVWPH